LVVGGCKFGLIRYWRVCVFLLLCFLCGTDLDKSSLRGHFLGDLDRLVGGLFDGIANFLEHDLDVGRLGSVLSDATVRPVGTTASSRGLVTLGVVNDAGINVQSLGLGVGDGIQDKILVDSGRLDGPSSGVTGRVDLLGHTLVADTSGKDHERNDGLVLEDVIEVLEGLVDLHALGDGGDFAAVLEMDAEVGSTGLGDLFRDLGFDAVSDHFGVFID
jgi:hypothetical protein